MSTKTKFPEIADIQLYREQVIKEINDTEHKTQYIEKNAARQQKQVESFHKREDAG